MLAWASVGFSARAGVCRHHLSVTRSVPSFRRPRSVTLFVTIFLLRRGRHSSLKHHANICFFPDTGNAFYISRTMQNNLIPNNYDARPARQAGNDGFVRPESHRHARRDRASLAAAGKRLPVGAGNDGEGRPAMTVSSGPNLIVTPDVIGRLLLPQGRDCRSGPAMTWRSGPAMTGRSGPAMTGKCRAEMVRHFPRIAIFAFAKLGGRCSTADGERGLGIKQHRR